MIADGLHVGTSNQITCVKNSQKTRMEFPTSHEMAAGNWNFVNEAEGLVSDNEMVI